MEYNHILTREEIFNYLKKVKVLHYRKHEREKFKQLIVDDFYTHYIISSYGRIFSVNYLGVLDRVAELKYQISKKSGYCKIPLVINGRNRTLLVHRLVAISFIENPENKYAVNHINGVKTDNYIWNLEWVTSQENTIHAYNTGLIQVRCGEQIGDSKFNTSQIKHVCKLLQTTYKSYEEIANITGVTSTMVRNIKNGRSWKHISKDYDFTRYDVYKELNHQIKVEQIKEVCKLLEENNLTMLDISIRTKVSFNMVYLIYKGQRWKEISKNYNISNYKPRSNASIIIKKININKKFNDYRKDIYRETL